MENVTLKLAEFLGQLTYDQIPEGVLSKAKSCVLDALGCAFLGSTAEPGKMVNEYVQSQKGVREASLWSTDFLGPAANVVLGNGTMIHSFDFDDYHMTKIHPGAVVIPAAMAVGEKEHIDGRSLLAAVVAGYETMIHISRGANPGASRLKGWHLTGTCGTFAAAAAVGHIWGLNKEGMASALGLAGTQSAGLWAFTADGSYSKRFHPGRASQSGVMAAWLARRGYQGPTKILEAEDGGFFKATSEDFDFQKVVEGLGEKFDTEDAIIKPYPACGSLHSSIDATLLLTKEHLIDPFRIKEIKVYNSRVVHVQCGFEYKPLGVLQAQMSMQYCVARAVLDGRLTMSQFSREKLSDPLVMDLAGRVRFVLDPEIDEIYPRAFPSVVEIVMDDGQRVKVKVAMPKGSS
ncbi:MAG: MmgE/PrpD family protein, partial [Pseudomonadota bacterium]